jgi:prepilin-type N-terminal cleavage/methylation domain-containing protein
MLLGKTATGGNMNIIHKGMTLIETMIAIAIFATVSAIFLQGMIATKHMESLGVAKDQVNLDAIEALRTITNDLALSAWDIPGDVTLPISFDSDRTSLYLPYVQIDALAGNTTARGSRFAETWRDEPNIRLLDLPPDLPGSASDADTLFGTNTDGWQTSYYARSQELIFLRQLHETWSSSPATTVAPIFFANGDWSNPSSANRDALGILPPSGWQAVVDGSGQVTGYAPREDVDGDGNPDQPIGVLLRAGELEVNGSELRLRPIWETVDAPDYQAITQEERRYFMYAVVPSSLGLGRLVRAYRARKASDPNPVEGTELGQWITPLTSASEFGMRVDHVLTDDCVRVIFDTFRTDSSLDVNQVRVRIFLARRQASNPDIVIRRVQETIVAMRARISQTDRDNDLKLLIRAVPLAY